VLKKSDGNIFVAFSVASSLKPIGDRGLRAVLNSPVTDLSLRGGMGLEFFNTIG
jgi:hypothetical protein